jgi:predicted dehydrogenase
MKKLRVAIIGQGRSGRNIHGAFYLSDENTLFEPAYVVDADEHRRELASKDFPKATVLCDYRELFSREDIDLVVNATYSEMHYPVTKDLLEHGFHVLCEKPFARNREECETLMRIAKEKNRVLAVFHNTQEAPFYLHALETVRSGKLGEIKQISIYYNGFARRWDWQTLQKKLAGSVYNTGPHPIAMALGFLDFDAETRVAFSKLDLALTSGDAEDYAKMILEAPNRPVIDLEISSVDAYNDFNLKIQGSRGTMKNTPTAYKMKYIVDGENPDRPVQEAFIHDENWRPIYCKEKLNVHEEQGTYEGTAFNVGTKAIYESVYYAITEGKPLTVTCEMAAAVIDVIDTVHAQNPLPVKF